MRIFVRVTEAGCFTKAASLASVKPPQVSRAIADVELRLHTRLLNRTTRHISLTEAGRHYLEHCEQPGAFTGLMLLGLSRLSQWKRSSDGHAVAGKVFAQHAGQHDSL